MSDSTPGGQPVPARSSVGWGSVTGWRELPVARGWVSNLSNAIAVLRMWADLVIYLVISIGAAAIIAVFHGLMTHQFVSMTMDRQLGLAVALYILVGPALWGLWRWQPGAIAEILRSLHSVTASRQSPKVPFDEFILRVQPSPLPSMLSLHPLAILAVLVAAGLTYVFIHVTSILGGSNPPLLFRIDPFAYPIPWVLVSFWNLCILTTVLIRHAIATVSLRRAGSGVSLAPVAFHPDGSGGLGTIGRYAVRCSWFALIYGLWIAVMLTGSRSDPSDATAWLFVLWPFGHLLLLAILIVAPVWSAHSAMRRAKHEQLVDIAQRIQNDLDTKEEDTDQKSRLETIAQLRQRYQIIEDAYREWPLRVPAIRGLSITGAIPLLTLAANFLKSSGLPLLPR